MAAPSASAATTAAPDDPRTTAPHPKGLYILFFTEMWERFSYYGMRALLMTYMVSPAFGYQPGEASKVYKWYTSLVYLAPLFGGLLADRVIGTRWAILAGAVLMAAGHFLMAFPSHFMFVVALGLLILGNGFFKPNISTTVGRMYAPDDPRRDRAFTIFYMGINLGAGLAGIVCSSLRDKFGFHWGFGAAGIAMMFGLLVFSFGQGQVKRDVEAVGNSMGTQKPAPAAAAQPGEPGYRENAREPESADESLMARAGGLSEKFADVYPFLMILAAAGFAGLFGFKFLTHQTDFKNIIMPLAFGAVFVVMAVLLMRLRGRQKDKSITIFVMFLFPVLFWMAFEQAGNALNLWAEDHTNRLVGMFGMAEYPGGWWQSANSVFIVALAPVFAIVWGWLARRGKEPSTPMKMFWAMVLMALSFLTMVFGAASESSGVVSVKYQETCTDTPETTQQVLDSAQQRRSGGASKCGHLAAGRLTLNSTGDLNMRGVLPDYTVRDVLAKTAPKEFAAPLKAFAAAAEKASSSQPVVFTIPAPYFDFVTEASALKDLKIEAKEAGSWTGPGFAFSKAATGGIRLEATEGLPPGVLAELYVAGSQPEWKSALRDLAKKSHENRVSGIWLLLSYLLATLGELCLSPVGLSMVTKLAPARFASLFMGVWLLSSSVAQYVGGSIGESWGEITPANYFWIFVGTSIFGCALVLALARALRKLMHNVA
jgi:proton-dependent oligopeptide transporter, POT family